MNFLNKPLYHNSIYDWAISIAIIAGAIILARGIYWLLSQLLKKFTKTLSADLGTQIIDRIDTPVALGIVLIGFRLSIERLTFPRSIENYLQRGFVFMSALAITWLITRIVRAIIEQSFKQYWEKENSRMDEQMLQLSKRASVVILWMLGFVVGLNNAGFDVGALIAGLGIGGLALALAAQDTVKNIIGGLVVFIDKPFRVGDIIKIKDIEGTVVYTGIRSSRIRTAAGRVITIPNAQFSDNAIENISREPSRRVVTNLSLAPETSTDKIDTAVAILKDIADNSEMLNSNDSIYFVERISPASIDISFIYFIRKDQNIHSSQTEINKLILSRFRKEGIEFALPVLPAYQKPA
ncbi:MAG: mechanosensitive ion channel family protein [Chitinophagales bacterium]